HLIFTTNVDIPDLPSFPTRRSSDLGGFGSMTAVHHGGIGQDQQLALDAPDQRVEVRAREIGAADGSREQDVAREDHADLPGADLDRKSTRLNSSHQIISYAVSCLKK